MALIHPDDLRVEADRVRAQATSLREIAHDLDQKAAALDAAAYQRMIALARQENRP